ncbi:TetR/AcrR family transcriptional regulator [Caulobacter soli]|uniref:TetR/AcrR family transcriptional regulator n=1 Tax=Caulobacter soli TaxID=2708539 RepID=UPI0013EBF8A0|nr:TetR/AcrR family transcriptional regulator [Caulobacter soli]
MAATPIPNAADCGRQEPSPRWTSRRQQILDAAGQCFRQSGFHGASMASIAALAGQSVGQIYRYFDNKEAIIAAIVDQHLVELHEIFDQLQGRSGSAVDLIVGRVPEMLAQRLDPSRAALVLEVVAEAARNPKIADILRAADAQERALCRAILARDRKPAWSDAEFEGRCGLLRILVDGLTFRAINQPDVDRAALVSAISMSIQHLAS